MFPKSVAIGIKMIEKGQRLLLSGREGRWTHIQSVFEGANTALFAWLMGTHVLVFSLLFNLNTYVHMLAYAHFTIDND